MTFLHSSHSEAQESEVTTLLYWETYDRLREALTSWYDNKKVIVEKQRISEI